MRKDALRAYLLGAGAPGIAGGVGSPADGALQRVEIAVRAAGIRCIADIDAAHEVVRPCIERIKIVDEGLRQAHFRPPGLYAKEKSTGLGHTPKHRTSLQTIQR